MPSTGRAHRVDGVSLPASRREDGEISNDDEVRDRFGRGPRRRIRVGRIGAGHAAAWPAGVTVPLPVGVDGCAGEMLLVPVGVDGCAGEMLLVPVGVDGCEGDILLPGCDGTAGETLLPGCDGTAGETSLPGVDGTAGETSLPGCDGTAGDTVAAPSDCDPPLVDELL